MKRMQRNVAYSASVGALVAVAILGMAMPASAGNLRAWVNADYSGALLVNANLAYMDVDDNKTTSIKNETSYYVSAQFTVGLVGYTMFVMPPGQNIPQLGGAQNDNIDHFIR